MEITLIQYALTVTRRQHMSKELAHCLNIGKRKVETRHNMKIRTYI